MAEIEKNIGESRMSEEPRKPMKFMLSERCVKEKHLADDAVTTRVIKDKNVTPEKLSNSVQEAIVTPITNQLDSKYSNITSSLDKKFTNKTNELYSMIASLQVGGVALSQAFGDNTDIGISQKTLTKALGAFYDELEDITGKHYKDCTITIEPTAIFTEEPGFVTVTADSTEAVCNFDSVRVYVDNVLVDEAIDMEVYTKNVLISQTCVVRVEGTILGKTTIKEESILKTMPFFMGSGEEYTDVMNVGCKKELHDGSLQGDYDITVNNTGDYIYIILPLSRKDEFRRIVIAKGVDMNGFEFPLEIIETDDVVIGKSLNQYQQGTYNIDININS